MNKKRILIVDDEPGLTRLLKLGLEATGKYDVRTENCAPQVLSTAQAFRPDLIVLDVLMPEMDGNDLAAQFKTNALVHQVPVVFLTAAAKKEEILAAGGQINGFPFLAKPVEIEELMTCIDRHAT